MVLNCTVQSFSGTKLYGTKFYAFKVCVFVDVIAESVVFDLMQHCLMFNISRIRIFSLTSGRINASSINILTHVI